MDLEQAVEEYSKNIKKLAEKNGVEYEIMLDNWQQKYEEFDTITDKYGFEEELDSFDGESANPFIALTINGSLVIASEPDEGGIRKVRYQSIKIRTDESSNVPKIFHAKIGGGVELKNSVMFEDTMETSFIIRIKTSDSIEESAFEEQAEAMTQEFTKKFELIDKETITKIIDID